MPYTYFSYHWVEHIDGVIVRQGDCYQHTSLPRFNLVNIKKHVRGFLNKPNAAIMILNLREITQEQYEEQVRHSSI